MSRIRPWDRLEPRHLQLLGLLAAASFFEGYDLNIVMVALPQLRHTFGLSQAGASKWITLLYLGALPALFWARRADRIGRRRLLMVSIVGYTAATAATAFAPDIAVFGACQLVARAFLALEVTLTWTVLAEELPADSRGFGFGMLAMLNALGAGTGALVWGLVMAPNHLSWRWLYLAATPVLLVVSAMRRQLPETTRFRAAQAAGLVQASWKDLFRVPNRRLMLVLCTASVLSALLTQASVFVVDFMQTQRHLSASAANLILVAAGALAIPVLVGAGSLSDRFGRKRVGCGFMALSFLAPIWFFSAAHGAAELFLGLSAIYVGQFGAWPTLSGFTTELFPTSHRALARSTTGVAAVAGQATSFLLAGVLISTAGVSRTVSLLAAGPAAALVLVVFLIPETAGRELREMSLIRSPELPLVAGVVADPVLTDPSPPVHLRWDVEGGVPYPR